MSHRFPGVRLGQPAMQRGDQLTGPQGLFPVRGVSRLQEEIGEGDGSLAVLKRNEDARAHMFERLSQNIRKLEGQVEDFAFLDVTSRLAKYLVEVARLGRPLPLTQEDLAAAVGSTRMTVNKLLADFERRGLIDVERRNVRVLDEKSLLREIRV